MGTSTGMRRWNMSTLIRMRMATICTATQTSCQVLTAIGIGMSHFITCICMCLMRTTCTNIETLA